METSEFLQKIEHTIHNNHLFSKDDDSILVGVSGGADSVTLLLCLNELGYKVAIAHCNFNLRGEESNRDQYFVESLAKKYSIPLHVRSFDTQEYAKNNKLSIEMAARNLRYDWFQMLCQLHQYTKIAIAHNQNDCVETFFINLLRSSGLKGLTGIPIRNGLIVRPLLNVSRNDIESYASQKGITFCTDSTNLGCDYVRNKIRNIILPELNKISSQSLHAITTTMNYLQESYAIYSEAIELKKQQFCQYEKNGFSIDECALQCEKEGETILYEILHPLGFNSDTIEQIFLSGKSQSGKVFESPSHRVIHDRNRLFVQEKQTKNVEQMNILQIPTIVAYNDVKIKAECVDAQDCTIIKDKNIAFLDYEKLQFPLILRHWKNGDSFVPFGMKGRKKVSDFLVDNKIPLHEKESIYVLESNGEIAWIVGQRISQLFAVQKDTKEIAIFSVTNH